MRPLTATLCLVAGVLSPLHSAPADPGTPHLVGAAQPSRVVQVGSAGEGLFDEILVERGDRVYQGQLLATLAFDVERANAELADARAAAVAAVETARTRLEHAQKKLERSRALHVDGIISAEELDVVRVEVRLEELALLRAQEDARVAELEARRTHALLERARVESPISGIVTDRFFSPGELYTRSSGTIVTVVQLDPLYIELYAPLELLDRLKEGDAASVVFPDLRAGEHRARVAVVDRVVDTASQTFRVRLELPNPELKLPAGVRCRVTLDPEAGEPR